MNTKQINLVLFNSIDPTRCNVIGTFPRNLIPQPNNLFPACYIANTDIDSQPGEHWVAFYFPNLNEYEFFDSFGQPPSTYNFPQLPFFSLEHFNAYRFQSLTSKTCGQFCLYFLLSRSQGYSFLHIQNSFSKSDYKWNDKFVRNLTNRFIFPKHVSMLSEPNSVYNTIQYSKSFQNFKIKF